MQEKRKKIKEINLNSNFNQLNEKSRNYIEDVLILIKKIIGFEDLYSIIVFGSQILGKEEDSPISDCDLLLIFNDDTQKTKLKSLEKYLISLEIKHNYQEFNHNFIKKVLFSLHYSTGMFKSHFITKRKYCEKAIFHKIFRVNRLFSFLFAPERIVLNSVINNHKELYGPSLNELIIKDRIPNHYDVLKNLIMTLLISFFAIAILPFKKLNAMKYQLEAIKWSLRASNYYLYKDSKSLKLIINQFLDNENLKKKKNHRIFFNIFLDLRNKIKKNINFMLKSPLEIFNIHKNAFHYKNLYKDKK
ncbi:MAG: hypothetical protein JXA99_05020 [Candidatus Lokiarchaeota archaeon]|nr:hypothetical protein [Candidatus Lokiarchaeota archaeon]